MLSFAKKPNYNICNKIIIILLFIIIEFALSSLILYLIFKPIDFLININTLSFSHEYNYILLTIFFIYSMTIFYYKVNITIELYNSFHHIFKKFI